MDMNDERPPPGPLDWVPDVRDLRRIQKPGWATPRLLKIAVVVVAAVVALSNTAFQIKPEEVGLVLRFGRNVRTTEPGLHFKLPFVEDVMRVPVQRQLKEEFGFRTAVPGIQTRYSNDAFSEESVMLTGDLNVAVVEWVVQYRVTDPYNYLFKLRGLTETFRSMNEAVMREVVGDRTVTEVLTVGRQEIATTSERMLQELVNQYEMGIVIEQIVLQDVTPPDPVKPSWDEVNQAQQQRDRLINEARAEYNKVIPRARGEAGQTILQAEGLRARARQRRAGRCHPVQGRLRRLPSRARRDAAPALSRDHAAGAAGARRQGLHGQRVRQRDPRCCRSTALEGAARRHAAEDPGGER